VLLGFLVLTALLGLALWLLRRSHGLSGADLPACRVEAVRLRLAAFGLLWFFLALSLESSVIPIVDVIYEHRVYLPSVGFFLFFAASCALLGARYESILTRRRVLALGAAAILLLTATTFARNNTWGDGIGFWQDVVSKSPGKARPHINLGALLSQAGRHQEALVSYQRAVRIVPDSAEALNNLGAALSALGRHEDAVRQLRQTIALHPEHAGAYYNLGRIYLLYLGRNSDGIGMLKKAITLDPGNLDAFVNLAAAYNLEHNYPATMRLLEPVLSALTDRADAHLNLGVAYAGAGNLPAAQRELALVAGLDPTMAAQLEQYLGASLAAHANR